MVRLTLSRIKKTTDDMNISTSIRAVCALASLGVMLLAAAGCSQEDKEKAKAGANNAIDHTSDALNTAADKVKEAAKDAGPKIKDGAQKVGEAITNGAAKAWDATKTEAHKASDAIKAKTVSGTNVNASEARSQSAVTTNDVQKE